MTSKHIVLIVHGARTDRPDVRHLVSWVRDKGHHVEPHATFEAGEAFAIGPFAIESRALPHSIPNAGVRISAGSTSITYTGDAGPTDDLVALATGSDLLLAEATYVESVPSGNEGVLNSALVVGHQARWAGAARLMLTHLLPGTDPDASRAAAGRFFDDWIAVATPGTIVDL